MRLAILGIGSLRAGPPVIASLATYFGERELEIRLFDADEERLDLFDRLARACFLVEDAKHELESFSNSEEALEGAEQAILMVTENCAKKFLVGRHGKLPSKVVTTSDGESQVFEPMREEYIGLATTEILVALPDGAPILSLMRGGEALLFESARPLELSVEQWPEPIDEETRWRLPHQILRWIKGDDPLFKLLEANRNSPIKRWLNDPTPNVPLGPS